MTRMRKIAVLLALPLAAACSKSQPPFSEGEVKTVFRKEIPASPADPAWNQVPMHPGKLLLQDVVEPRLLAPSTSVVNVQAVTNGKKIGFRLTWDDPTVNDLPGPGRFGDACAVQLPSVTSADAPAPTMGEEGRPVEISFWSAYFQASVDGRKDDIHSIYPNARVDHYPFEAAPLKPDSQAQREMARRYAPARSLGNAMAGPRTVPVQDLVAEGPGTLRPAEKGASSGSGKRVGKGWSVEIVRPLPAGVNSGGRSIVAFAVWEGSREEVGARKMRTGWIPLSVEGSNVAK